jgi:hypothetical protein
MAYATIDMVKALSPHLFNQSNAPTDSDVRLWLDEGQAIIDGTLTSKGYTAPVAKTASVWPILRNLDALYAASMAEFSKLVASTAAGAQTRGELLERRFWDRLDKTMRLDLSGMGVGYTSLVYVGGISISDKDTVEDDSDRVQTAFSRGQFAYGSDTSEADEQTRSDD